MPLPKEIKVRGLQGAIAIIQKIQITEDDRDKFPTHLIDKKFWVIQIKHCTPNINPFFLNAKQTFEYLKKPTDNKINVYGPVHFYDIKRSESTPIELCVMCYIEGELESIARFNWTELWQCLDSIQKEHPEISA